MQKEDRIQKRLQEISRQLYELEGGFTDNLSHRDYKELKKKETKLLKEGKKLRRRLESLRNNNTNETKQ